MSEFNKKRAAELAELIKARWPQAWQTLAPVHPNTVMLEVGGAWLYLAVTATLTHITYCAQLYGNNTGGVTWTDVKLSDVPPEQVADSVVRYLTPWLEGVQYEARTPGDVEYEIHTCTTEVADHTGSCGCWTTSRVHSITRAASVRHSTHVVIHVRLGDAVHTYAEFIRGVETAWSIESRRLFAALS